MLSACIFTVALILCVLLDAVDQSYCVPSPYLHVVFNRIGIAPGPLCFLFSPSGMLFAGICLSPYLGALLKCHFISVVFPSACIENSILSFFWVLAVLHTCLIFYSSITFIIGWHPEHFLTCLYLLLHWNIQFMKEGTFICSIFLLDSHHLESFWYVISIQHIFDDSKLMNEWLNDYPSESPLLTWVSSIFPGLFQVTFMVHSWSCLQLLLLIWSFTPLNLWHFHISVIENFLIDIIACDWCRL